LTHLTGQANTEFKFSNVQNGGCVGFGYLDFDNLDLFRVSIPAFAGTSIRISDLLIPVKVMIVLL